MTVALLALVASGAFGAASAHGAFPGDNGDIVFTELFFLGGQTGTLHSIAPDGTDEHQILSDAGFASFSADGETLVYSCDSRLCTSNPEGKNRKKLPKVGKVRQRWPGFDRSGKRLVFVADSGDLMVSKANGKKAKRVPGSGNAWQPEFFPTGDRIVFSKKVGKSRGIYTVRANGKGLKRITKAPATRGDFNPSVSPDGKLIAFERHDAEGGGTAQVLTVQPNGTGEKEVLVNAGTPAFSPDGKKLAFQSIGPSSTYRIGVADADGANRTEISTVELALLPAWQPLP
jgi:Tol biopolymer transport system component